MKKTELAIVLLLLLSFFSVSICKAQTETPDSTVTTEKESKFKISVAAAYSSRLHYYGRTDSLKSSALLPTIVIQAGKHFTFTPSFIFINNSTASFNYAASTINATYNFGKKKGIAGTIYADKFFYKQASELVRSVQQGQGGFTLSYLNKIININSGASTAFSKSNTDFFATASLDHQFKKVKGDNVFLITPSVAANAGTQNFTKSYYKKNNFLFFPTTEELVTEDSKQFSLLSYDFNLSLIYAYKRCIINVTPGYVLPQSIITVPNNPSLSERACNLFYCNAVFIYKLVK
ncbi:hypothetical protein [Ferruginibacter profundus]